MKSLALFCAALTIIFQFTACAGSGQKSHCCAKAGNAKTCTDGSCKVK